MYPYTAYEDSYIHNAFENAGATLSGVETAYRVLKKRESWMSITNLSPLAETAVLMISGFSLFPVLWREGMTWYMSAMTMALT